MMEPVIVYAARVGDAMLGVGCTGFAILIAVNFRSWASRLIERGQLLASRRWGLLFRGEYSRTLVFIMTLGILDIGMDAFAGIGVPGADRVAPVVFWLFMWLLIGFAAVVQLRSRFQQMIPPISGLVALVLIGAHIATVFEVTAILSQGR